MMIFVAGATGATGQVFVPMATREGLELRIHVRPQTVSRSPLSKDSRAKIFDLSDAGELKSALNGCDAIVSFVGTMRSRFKAGDTYESSDIGSTRALVDGARSANVPRFLLLSSVGAGGPGAYLKMKGECERIVQRSSLRYTIFRPSALLSPPEPDAPVSHHGRRDLPALAVSLASAAGSIPGLRTWSDRYKPIPIVVLCRAFLRVIQEPRDGQLIEGADLWELGRGET